MEAFGLTLVAAAHLAAVYVAMAAPAICLWLQWRAGRDELARRLDVYLLRLSVASLVLAMALGGLAVALIARLFPQPYLNAFHELPRRRYEFGVVELIFTLACYGLALRWRNRADRSPPERAAPRRWFALRWWATFLGALNLAYHFPPLFVMLGVLTTRAETWGRQARFTSLLADSEILARTFHHWLAAAVVGGLALAYYGLRRGAAPDDRRAVVWGCRLAAAAMLLQVVSGVLLVAELPVATRHALLGDDALATGLFAAAVLAAFFVLPRLAAIGLGHVERRHALGSCLLVFLVLLLMTAARHRTRHLLTSSQVAPGLVPDVSVIAGAAESTRHRRLTAPVGHNGAGPTALLVRQAAHSAIYSRHADGTDYAHRRGDRLVGQNSFGPGIQLL